MKRDGLDSSLGAGLGSATFCGGRGRCVPSSAGECFAQGRPSAAATAEVQIDFPKELQAENNCARASSSGDDDQPH